MNVVGKALRVLREQGMRETLRRARSRLVGEDGRDVLLARPEDVEAVDWRTPHPAVATPADRGPGPWTVAWIMSPPGLNSGGHQTALRMIKALERAGHVCRIYLYSNERPVSIPETQRVMAASKSFEHVAAELLPWTGELPADTDAVFATGWETAYPSFRSASPARRFYFVQDFEPWFAPAGSESTLAESTYRFGFHGITAGRWLSAKLHDEYGMSTDAFDFGADPGHYAYDPAGSHDEIMFYARPATERRGFELGLLVLGIVARERPGTVINLVGTRVHRDLPFPYRSLHGVGADGLGEIFNRCAAGLVLSFSNMSLMPLELLAAGAIPVVNDAPNNRLVVDNPHIAYAPPLPRALADALIAVLDDPERSAHAAEAAASVTMADWSAAGRQFLDAFERAMR
ncbi:MAG TPA: glycosyltransferase family 1 protein [Microbacteriaceae bacterium]|nr:glycosyltransferase family 1 protein [Microbacteriaceae bacterium]